MASPVRATPVRPAEGSFDVSRPPAAVREEDEHLFWTLMRRFETQALEHYRAQAPELATSDKARFVAAMSSAGADDDLLAASALREPIEDLLDKARNVDRTSTLIIQGMILEHLGQAIYRLAEKTDSVSEPSRRLCRQGLSASETVTPAAISQIAEHIGREQELYVVFAEVSHDVLGAMDAVGEPVDQIFGEDFGLHFADVMGEFTADLIGTCTALGMQRRKVVAQLAGACMGL